MNKIEAIIEKEHIDLYEHLNNSCYGHYFDKARKNLQDKIGFNDQEIKEDGLKFVVNEINIKLKKQLYENDKVEIISEMVYKEPIKFFIEHKMYKENELVAECKTLHIFIEKDLLLFSPPQKYLERFREYETNNNQE
jgi:YbgC/YbaW family acyl-CoA thioester hydrolase